MMGRIFLHVSDDPYKKRPSKRESTRSALVWQRKVEVMNVVAMTCGLDGRRLANTKCWWAMTRKWEIGMEMKRNCHLRLSRK
jgi:hypothetical protein